MRSEWKPPFQDLIVWKDSQSRSSQDQIQVDHDLLERGDLEKPLLRFYQWEEPTITVGYFQDPLEIQSRFTDSRGLQFVKRWTGGGMVDHRLDTPYTLVIPHQWVTKQPRSSLWYQVIHEALLKSLSLQGEKVSLFKKEECSREVKAVEVCFDTSVCWDLVREGSLQKVSGAAQRRTRQGLLHQASVCGVKELVWQDRFPEFLAAHCQVTESFEALF